METESNNTKTKHKKLIYIIIFAGILYGLQQTKESMRKDCNKDRHRVLKWQKN